MNTGLARPPRGGMCTIHIILRSCIPHMSVSCAFQLWAFTGMSTEPVGQRSKTHTSFFKFSCSFFLAFRMGNRLTNRLPFQLLVVSLRSCIYIVTGRKLCNLNSPNISSTGYSAAPAGVAVLHAQIANPTHAVQQSRLAWRTNSP